MTPSKKEIEDATGEIIPDDAPIKEVSSLPTPEEQLSEGVVFKSFSIINKKWKLFLATKLGEIVAVYLLLITLGVPLPKPFEVVYYSADKFADISYDVYAYLSGPKEKAEGYLVSLPPEYSVPVDTKQTSLYDLPVGSGMFPVSGSYLG